MNARSTNPEKINAVTLDQPWPSLIAVQAKLIEPDRGRPRRPPSDSPWRSTPARARISWAPPITRNSTRLWPGTWAIGGTASYRWTPS